MRGEFLDLDGVRLYYYAAGTRGGGDPVVLIHGFPTSSHLWNGVVPLLPQGHRVVVIDLLGFGRSDPPGNVPVDIRAHADRMFTVFDHLGINRACVVGHDVGGGVALSMAVRRPQRVSRLGLVSSVAFDGWPSREVKLARAMLPLTRHLPPAWILSVVRTNLLRGYQDHDRGSHDVELFLRPFGDMGGRDALAAHFSALQCDETKAVAARLKDIVCPTMIIWGEKDPFLPAAMAQRLHATIPGSEIEVIPAARHFIPVECSHAVAAAVGRLLAR